MIIQRLPITLQPVKMATQRVSHEGTLSLALFSRLAQHCESLEGEVTVTLESGRDIEGLVFLKGYLSTVLSLQCQRCNDPFEYPVSTEFMLSPVFNHKDAKGLPSHYDPLLLDEDSVVVETMVEDELLLSLPLIPKHDLVDCKVKELPKAPFIATPKKNPFAVLKRAK